MELKRLEELDRARVNAFLISRWFSLEMLVHGETIDLSNVQGKAILESGEIIGMITWRTLDDALEILSLDSLHEGQGIGTILLEQAVAETKKQRLRRLVLTTTNDALRALQFYQRRGFDLLCLRRGVVYKARKKKPQIPLTGENGIPLHHEIDLERIL